jgi:hypothetical protein
MSAAVSIPQTQPSVRFWNKGRRPEEQGYAFDGGTSISLCDIARARSFNELHSKGVPESVCNAARKAGYMPSELDEMLDSGDWLR